MTESLPKLGPWLLKALCQKRHIDPDLFFVDPISPEIIKLCAKCPVHDDCLEYALANHPHGTWAGTTYRDRWRLRKQRRIAAASVVPSHPRSVCPGCRQPGLAMPVGGGQLECGGCGAMYPSS